MAKIETFENFRTNATILNYAGKNFSENILGGKKIRAEIYGHKYMTTTGVLISLVHGFN